MYLPPLACLAFNSTTVIMLPGNVVGYQITLMRVWRIQSSKQVSFPGLRFQIIQIKAWPSKTSSLPQLWCKRWCSSWNLLQWKLWIHCNCQFLHPSHRLADHLNYIAEQWRFWIFKFVTQNLISFFLLILTYLIYVEDEIKEKGGQKISILNVILCHNLSNHLIREKTLIFF